MRDFCGAFWTVLVLVGCGATRGGTPDSSPSNDAGLDGNIPDSGQDASRGDSGFDAHSDENDGGSPDLGLRACFDFGDSCGAVRDPVCCEGTCGPIYRLCCSEPAGACEIDPLHVNDGCCAGSVCNPDTELCETRTCFSPTPPGTAGPDCMGTGETAPCCDTDYECTPDLIYGSSWCCAPTDMIIDRAREADCCSGSFEILPGARVRCLPG